MRELATDCSSQILYRRCTSRSRVGSSSRFKTHSCFSSALEAKRILMRGRGRSNLLRADMHARKPQTEIYLSGAAANAAREATNPLFRRQLPSTYEEWTGRSTGFVLAARRAIELSQRCLGVASSDPTTPGCCTERCLSSLTRCDFTYMRFHPRGEIQGGTRLE